MQGHDPTVAVTAFTRIRLVLFIAASNRQKACLIFENSYRLAGRRSLKKDFHPSYVDNPSHENPSKETRPKRFNLAVILSFLILFTLWIVLSGRFDGFHITLGLISSAIVTAFTGDLMFTSRQPQGIFRLWLRLAGYVPWLIYQIFLANLHVLYLVFHPRMMALINPKIINFNSRIKSDYSRMVFANSITLTPGTITVNVTALGRFSVHCIDDASGQSLPGEMEERIANVFKE
jgi:multicomponent Na+:H+ antiporter subunit E